MFPFFRPSSVGAGMFRISPRSLVTQRENLRRAPATNDSTELSTVLQQLVCAGQSQALVVEMDCSLSGLELLERYLGSEHAVQREFLARELCETAAQCGFAGDDGRRLVNAVRRLLEDSSVSVRHQARAAHSRSSASRSGETEEDRLLARSQLFASLFEKLGDVAFDVSTAAADAISGAATEFLPRQELEEVVLQRALSMMSEDTPKYDPRVGAKILLQLSQRLGKQLCEDHVLPVILQAAQSERSPVQQCIAENIGLLATVISVQDESSELLEQFLALCRHKFWEVRKACCQSYCGVSSASTHAVRVSVLCPRLMVMLNDETRAVCAAATMIVPPFLLTFRSPPRVSSFDESPTIATSETLPPDELIDIYCKIPLPTSWRRSGNEVTPAMAQSFPDVLEMLGGASAWPRLSDAFAALCMSSDIHTRSSLARVLGRIARIVGDDITDKELVRTVEDWVVDSDVNVVTATMESLPDLLRVLSSSETQQRRLLESALRQSRTSQSLQLRMTLARMIPALADSVPAALIVRLLEPTLALMLEDGAHSVRFLASQQVGRLLEICDHHAYSSSLTESMLALAKSESYRKRSQFVHACPSLLQSLSLSRFRELRFLDELFRLQADQVPNVRIAVASVLRSEPFSAIGDVETRMTIQALLRALVEDLDLDVVTAAGGQDISHCIRRYALARQRELELEAQSQEDAKEDVNSTCEQDNAGMEHSSSTEAVQAAEDVIPSSSPPTASDMDEQVVLENLTDGVLSSVENMEDVSTEAEVAREHAEAMLVSPPPNSLASTRSANDNGEEEGDVHLMAVEREDSVARGGENDVRSGQAVTSDGGTESSARQETECMQQEPERQTEDGTCDQEDPNVERNQLLLDSELSCSVEAMDTDSESPPRMSTEDERNDNAT